jgi:predicted nucleic acid-binding protein
VSLYVDTSCIVKVLFPEPESDRVAEMFSREPRALVSSLTRLETLVQIRGREIGRAITRRDAAYSRQRLAALLETSPFESVEVPSAVVEIAERQVREGGARGHCRMLDRLHLATMEGLGVRRLFTNDDQQAAAARALGFDVSVPR